MKECFSRGGGNHQSFIEKKLLGLYIQGETTTAPSCQVNLSCLAGEMDHECRPFVERHIEPQQRRSMLFSAPTHCHLLLRDGFLLFLLYTAQWKFLFHERPLHSGCPSMAQSCFQCRAILTFFFIYRVAHQGWKLLLLLLPLMMMIVRDCCSPFVQVRVQKMTVIGSRILVLGNSDGEGITRFFSCRRPSPHSLILWPRWSFQECSSPSPV
jgi:hypothetical protein